MTQSLAMPDERPQPTHDVLNGLSYLGIALFGTIVSLLMSGYIGGWGNNYYHLPILTGLYDEPQFSNDMFIQSLRYYSSGFWQLLSGRLHGDGVYYLLFLFQIVSRTLLFVGMLEWAKLLGIGRRREQLAFTVLLALSAILQGVSKAGGGGLLIDNFTQSELANGTTLLALAWAARRRIALSFAMNGVTFFINAFIAVWTAVPLLFILWCQWRDGEWSPRALMRQVVIGLVVAAILSSPIIYNIATNPYSSGASAFDYVSFLEEFYPFHFLVWSIPRQDILQLAIIFGCGIVATAMLRVRGAFLMPALLGAATVWILGALLPFITDSRMLLDLHLLRSSSTIHLLSAITIAALATRWMFSVDEADRLLWAPALVVLSCTFKTMLVLFVPLLLLRWIWPAAAAFSWRRWIASGLLLAAGLFVAVHVYGVAVWEKRALAGRDQWQALGQWAQAQTPSQAIFLMPPGISRGTKQISSRSDEYQDRLFEGSEVFQYFAHRRAWIFTPGGAAVMWAPAYYSTWKDRLTEVKKLQSLPERLDYASREGIAYVVDGCPQPGTQVPVARFGELCVFAASESPAS
ncbi:hypothetical protein LMIY3S_03532 [Labrys miyagiensis]